MTTRITNDNLDAVLATVYGAAPDDPVLDQYDWYGYYPVVGESGRVIDIAPADSTAHDIVDEMYMTRRAN